MTRKGRSIANLFRVRTLERELHEYVYFVSAPSAMEAEEAVQYGGLDYANHRYLEGEITKIEAEEVKEDGF